MEVLTPDLVRKSMNGFYENLEKLDVGNLLNEDLERSRNSFLFVCFVTVCIAVLDVQQVSIVGAKVSLKSNGEFVIFGFLIAASILMAAYYLVNVRSSIIDKSARYRMLSLALVGTNSKLSEHQYETENAKRTNQKGLSKVDEELLKTLSEEIAKSQLAIEDFETSFKRQKAIAQALPVSFVVVGVMAEALAIWVGRGYY
ncbi:hypothetical protein NBRC116590_17170 [Pelagimonas sp. KU-00592-HH]|uniref:hypothetical protein n=1 Tax=Pelagimonas sp. KU-00592-HH TaxID=3127651 RepID=UPI0031021D95